MAVEQPTGRTAAVVVPSERAHTTWIPLGLKDVRLRDGLLHEHQRLNRETTLLHGYTQLENAGTLANFRIAAGRLDGDRRGMVFSDSDVYKFLEALAWEMGREPSAYLAQLADDLIESVVATQLPDGYLNTYCQIVDPGWRWTDLEMGHELYCAGHLIQAAVAFARATDDTRLLQVACRFADLIDQEFRLGSQQGTDGHPEIESALVELFRVTGQVRYLELAKTLIDRRGQWNFEPIGQFDREYFQELQPVRDTRTIHGHAVRALYLLAAVTDLYAEIGDDDLLKSAVAQWEDLAASKLYLTGGIGSRHFGEAIGDPHELPPDRAYCETCASIASIMWNWRMLLATGDPRHADLIERTLYNGFLAGLSLAGDAFFYVNPLQSRTANMARTPWHPVACCPPNIMRLLASLQQYVATSDDDGLQVHQYCAADIETTVGRSGGVGVRVHCEFPWNGHVEIEVIASVEQPWNLSLRVPAWATTATVDGRPVDSGTYVKLRRVWRAGDRVRFDIDMLPRLTAPHPRVDAVRGCVAIERGPLVYCIEQADLGADTELARVRLNAEPMLADAGRAGPDLANCAIVGFRAVLEDDTKWGSAAYRASVEATSLADARHDLNAISIPYFAWGNRQAGPMRVWVPVSN